MVAGEKKELGKVSVGNIITDDMKKKARWAKMRKELLADGFTEKEVDEMLGGGGFSKLAGKVRRMLKASKRRGKRRTKKQLLRDVLDL